MAGLGFVKGRGGQPSKIMGIKFVRSSESLATDPASRNVCPSGTSPNRSKSPGAPQNLSWGSAAVTIKKEIDLKGPIPLMDIKLSESSSHGATTASNPAFSIKTEVLDNKQEVESSGPSSGLTAQCSKAVTTVKTGGNSVSSGNNMSSRRPVISGKRKKAGSSNQNKAADQPPPITFPRTPEAKPLLTKEEYFAACKDVKDPQLLKIKQLAYEVISLKTDRPNAKDKLHSAANRVPILIEFSTEPVAGPKNSNSFLCYVFVDGVATASGQGLKIKDAKTNAYEAALQKILMPHLRIVQLDPEKKDLQGSKEPFTSPPPEPSKVPLPKAAVKLPPSVAGSSKKAEPAKEVESQLKVSNKEAAGIKRRFNEQKALEDFVIVEPLVLNPDCTPAHTLRRSADFNHMLLEYEYFLRGEAARCVVKVENQVVADAKGASKVSAKNMATSQALKKLKSICWVIKTKKEVDSNTKISKEEMLNELHELNEKSDVIGYENVGNKLLRKMGWSGGGVGRHGSGIVEPVTLESVLNREGLGLSARKGVTEEFKKRAKEVIEFYAASGIQEDLVFDFDFRLDERQIIHDECRRLNLRSKCRGKGRKRYICIRRKRSANELFDHIMACGGETARYILIPPGSDGVDDKPKAFTNTGSKSLDKDKESAVGKDQNLKGGSTKGSSATESRHGDGLLPPPSGLGLLGRAPLPPGSRVPGIDSLFRDLKTSKGIALGNVRINKFGFCCMRDSDNDFESGEDQLRKEIKSIRKRNVANFEGMGQAFGMNCGSGDEYDQWGMQQNGQWGNQRNNQWGMQQNEQWGMQQNEQWENRQNGEWGNQHNNQWGMQQNDQWENQHNDQWGNQQNNQWENQHNDQWGNQQNNQWGNQHNDQWGNQQNKQWGNQQNDQWGNQQNNQWGNQQNDQWGNQQNDQWGNQQNNQWGNQQNDQWGNQQNDQWGMQQNDQRGNQQNDQWGMQQNDQRGNQQNDQWGMQQNGGNCQQFGNGHNNYDDQKMRVSNMGNGNRGMGVQNIVNGEPGMERNIQGIETQNMESSGRCMRKNVHNLEMQNMGNAGLCVRKNIQDTEMRKKVNNGKGMGRNIQMQDMANGGRGLRMFGMKRKIQDVEMQNAGLGVRMPKMRLGMQGSDGKDVRVWNQQPLGVESQRNLKQNVGNFPGIRMPGKGRGVNQVLGNWAQNMRS